MKISGIFFILLLCLTACHKNNSQSSNMKAASINIQLGVAYLNEGDLPRAKQKFSQALQQAPSSSQAYEAMGLYYETTKQPHLAKLYYQKAIALAPYSGQPHNTYGTFLCRQKQYHTAIKEFEIALKDVNYPNTAKTLENAGLCAKVFGQLNEAAQYFEQALNEDPSRTLSEKMLAELKKSAQA